MSRVQETDELGILRFFEEEPLEKAEMLYRIVADKMKKRMPPGKTAPKKKDMRAPRQPGQNEKREDEVQVP